MNNEVIEAMQTAKSVEQSVAKALEAKNPDEAASVVMQDEVEMLSNDASANITPVIDKSENKLVATHTYSHLNQGDWRVFGCSMQGKDHLTMNPVVPCQDNHCLLPIDDGWGVVVVCDGAGSHKYSHIGSKFVSQFVAERICQSVKETNFYQGQTLPSEENWRNWCKALVWQTRQALGEFVVTQKETVPDMDIGNVGCTLIFAVFSPFGILSAHVGDGRAGYRDAKRWQSMMTPFNGEYSNQTVFLNSDYIYQDQLENPKEPTRPFLETKVVAGAIVGFVLMSDGCENGLYYVDEYDTKSKKVIEINRPIDGFDHIIQMLDLALAESEASAKELFLQMISKGNQPLIEEGDDKTLVLGYLVG